MCLSTITERYDPPLAEERTAWKVFEKYSGDLHFEFKPLGKSRRVPLEQWIVAQREKLWTFHGTPYTSGFHCFRTRKAARVWAASGQVVRRVLIRNVTYSGWQASSVDSFPVLVAQEMFVPEES